MKFKQFFSVIIGAAALSGCANSENTVSGNELGTPTQVNIMLINKQLPLSKAPSGKEDGTVAESKISWLEFYVFDATGNTLDPEVGRIDASTPGNGYLKITTTEFSHKLSVSAGANKKFIVVANSNIGAPAAGYNTYDGLKAKLSSASFAATSGGTDHNSRNTPSDGFEMSGYTTATIISERSDNNVYLTIMRLVSKINAPNVASNVAVTIAEQNQINEIWGETTTVTPASGITFTLNGFAVVNGVTKSSVSFVGNATGNYIDPINSPWSSWSLKTYLNSVFNLDGSYKNNYSGEQSGSWFLDGVQANNGDRVYVYENKPSSKTVNSVVGYEPGTVYAYIIKGTLKTADDVDAIRYWRVDLIKTDSYHIMRNCVYKVTINKISTPGYATPEEAENIPSVIPAPGQSAADFYISVAQWDVVTYTTGM